MKSKQIISIFAALALAAGSAALMTGCAGKSYLSERVTTANGKTSYKAVSEIADKKAQDQASTTSAASETTETPAVDESSAETPVADESSEEAPVADESSEEAPVADESSEEAPVADESSAETPAGDDEIQTDENTLAVIKLEKPEDWDENTLTIRVWDSNKNENGNNGQQMTLGNDGKYYAVISKIATSSGAEYTDPQFKFMSNSKSAMEAGVRATVVQSEDGTINGSKTYSLQKEGKKFLLVEN